MNNNVNSGYTEGRGFYIVLIFCKIRSHIVWIIYNEHEYLKPWKKIKINLTQIEYIIYLHQYALVFIVSSLSLKK